MMRGFVPPEDQPKAEWVRYRDESRTVYQSEAGQKRVEWTSPAHEAIRVAVPYLKAIRNSNGNLSAGQLSDSVRLLAEMILALISVALHQDNPEDDPIVGIPPGEG